MSELMLVPMPKVVERGRGGLVLGEEMWVVFEGRGEVRDIFAAERFVIEAEPLTGSAFHIAVSAIEVDSKREIRVRYGGGEGVRHGQGYRLVIGEEGIEIVARTGAGVFYGFQTLMQIVRGAVMGRTRKNGKRGGGVRLPAVRIEDWPDFERRGVYHDCARGKVPTVDTLLQLIDDLGHLKINEFQLYVENGFEFRKHPEMWDDMTPFTAEEMLLLDSACRARHIDFVPSLTSLGHFEKILSRPAFRHLAEVEPEELKRAGVKTWSDQPWTLCVTDEGAKRLLKEMYEEFVPNFSSGMFNICCDESWDLGKGRSKDLLEKVGAGRMYVDWVNYCAGLARGLGKRIQMWGDIILNHPELIGELPGDATLLEWGYESHHKFDEHLKVFAERIGGGGAGAGSERAFYVAPGTASWLSLASRSRNALGNIYRGAAAGLKYGAKGLLVTDWGDNGHQQMLSVSMVAFAYGAAAGWNLEGEGGVTDPSIEEAPDWETGIVPAGTKGADWKLEPFLRAVSVQMFEDASGRIAGLAYQLGLTYERFTWQRFNGSLEWFLFRERWEVANYVNRVRAGDLRRVMGACEKLRAAFEKAEFFHPDAEQIRAEFVFTCDEIVHTCKRTGLRQAWLAVDPRGRIPEAPEHEALRARKPVALPKEFGAEMKKMEREAAGLEKTFVRLWVGRNKRSRVEDVVAEFRRLREEYRRFGRG